MLGCLRVMDATLASYKTLRLLGGRWEVGGGDKDRRWGMGIKVGGGGWGKVGGGGWG